MNKVYSNNAKYLSILEDVDSEFKRINDDKFKKVKVNKVMMNMKKM